MSTPRERLPRTLPIESAGETPRHGFQGDRGPSAEPAPIPAHLTIAISREAGARGGSIGRRVGRLLNWQIYDQELLEYIAQDGNFRSEVVERAPQTLHDWTELRVQQLLREQTLSQHPSIVNLSRVILTLGATGEVVLVGRGAGLLLPRESTLHVRILAPLEDRIAYMSQWLRLSREEATERVRVRDGRRAEYLQTHFHHLPNEFYQFDMLLNSSLLGEELCAELIVKAARAKQALTGLQPTREDDLTLDVGS